jgi:hypothetical protein
MGVKLGGWIRLHNEELHKLYALPDFIRMIKLRRGVEQGM